MALKLNGSVLSILFDMCPTGTYIELNVENDGALFYFFCCRPHHVLSTKGHQQLNVQTSMTFTFFHYSYFLFFFFFYFLFSAVTFILSHHPLHTASRAFPNLARSIDDAPSSKAHPQPWSRYYKGGML